MDWKKRAKIKLRLLLGEIEFLTSQIEELEKEIEKLVEETEVGEYIKSVPGIGTIITAIMLGEIGDINRFRSWKEIRKLAGLNLYEISSGEHTGKTQITRRGRPLLRKIIYLMAQTTLKHNPEMKIKYKQLRKREKNSLKVTQALIAIGLKMIRIIFKLAKSKTKYNAEKVYV
ncbi:transposase [Marinitoga sp. 38H-ov]|uniref:transposase n=1 Tax=Marinitoga sp. 38H-ov TaxID=1755814 RepID=UPI0019D0B4B0|nr:transposase [Marinitoga sp. 38H-ov]